MKDRTRNERILVAEGEAFSLWYPKHIWESMSQQEQEQAVSKQTELIEQSESEIYGLFSD